jgi:UDP-N-acetylmuramoylalanine-D-glutamate ligase
MQKIHIIGEGITAKAVREKITADKLFTEASLEDCDFVVVSPGTKPKDFPDTEKEIISEIEFAFRYYVRSPVIAITGTNGKSTVTALIAEGLGVEPLGNFGKPLILANFDDPYHVVEVSSYQLEGHSTFHPNVGVFLNLTPDHLQRHGSMKKYAEVKGRLFSQFQSHDTAVLNKKDFWCRKIGLKIKGKKVWFPSPGLLRIASGTPIFPMSCMGAASRRFSVHSGSKPISRATMAEYWLIRQRCARVSWSLNSTAPASRMMVSCVALRTSW